MEVRSADNRVVFRPTPLSQPVNVSTRGNVLGGENVLIGGFIVGETTTKKVMVRALGPSLQQFGITNALSDPVLQVFGSAGNMRVANDNWRDTQATDIIASGLQRQDNRESAIVITLPAGDYTAIVRSNNAIDIGLVEVYDLDEAADPDLTNISTRGLVQGGEHVLIGGFILGKPKWREEGAGARDWAVVKRIRNRSATAGSGSRSVQQ